MKLSERIDLLAYLGAYLQKGSEQLDIAIRKTYFNNRWFTQENVKATLDTIAQQFLQKEQLVKWVNDYSVSDTSSDKRVGLVLDGNIPLSGFHDLIAVFINGHVAKIKLSEKDKILIPHFIKVMSEINEEISSRMEVSERMTELDAIIVRGNNKSIRYFKTYFGKYPNIITEQKSTIALLNGQESPQDLISLGDDVFSYFGLGPRNVSKIYVPENFDFQNLLEALHEHRDLVHHDKYKNNFDYNYTLIILNKIAHHSNGCILMTEDPALQSRIAQLHYEFYKDEADLKSKLQAVQEEIEIIIGNPIADINTSPFGNASKPGLFDYEGGVDTMKFLIELN